MNDETFINLYNYIANKIADEYNLDKKFIANSIVLSTILSILTLIVVGMIFLLKIIRGIIILMTILMIGGYFLLIIIKEFIMPLTLIDINIFGIIIPTNILISLLIALPCLVLWYYISIKYFWHQISKMPED